MKAEIDEEFFMQISHAITVKIFRGIPVRIFEEFC